MKMSNPRNFFDTKPKFPFDDDFRHENDWEMDDLCPNCNHLLSEHTRNDKIRCVLERIGGVPD